MGDERWLTVPEVAERMRVKPETVRVWLREGKLRGVQPISKRTGWRVSQTEVTRLLQGEPAEQGTQP